MTHPYLDLVKQHGVQLLSEPSMKLKAGAPERLLASLGRLMMIGSGLELLYQSTRKLEREQCPFDPHVRQFSFGGTIDPSATMMVVSFYDWYSVSSSNFALVLSGMIDEGSSGGHIEGVVPTEWNNVGTKKSEGPLSACVRRGLLSAPILKWRNKIAAHPSVAYPKDESEPTRNMSQVPLPQCVDGRFCVAELAYSTSRVTKFGRVNESSSEDLDPWSLTKEHERIVARHPFMSDCCRPTGQLPKDSADGAQSQAEAG